jgi:GNAT superfamily N-acetyltransferase
MDADRRHEIRIATPEDAALVAQQRRLMFDEAGHYDTDKLMAMEVRFRVWVHDMLERGEYRGYLLTCDGLVAAGAGLWIQEGIVNPNDLSGRQGYIGNVYTLPPYRRRGFARELMRQILDWCRAHEIHRVVLYPTEQARALYQSLGFERADLWSARLP